MLQSFDKLGWCAFLARTIYTRGRNCEQKSVIGVEPNVLPPGRIPNLRQSLWRFLVEHGLIFLFGWKWGAYADLFYGAGMREG